MDQVYIEVLVARKRNMAALAGKIGCILLAVVCFSQRSVFAFPLAVVFGMLAYYFNLQEQIEYEYSYVSRELTIDKIMAKSRRKTMANYLLDKIEIGGREDSSHLDGCRGRKCSISDYSSRNGQTPFVFYYEGQKKIILDADENLIQALHAAAPGKIFLN